MSRLSSVPSAPAFAGSSDPGGLVRVLAAQLQKQRAQLRQTPTESARHGALAQRVADTKEALQAARAAARRASSNEHP